jgi:hypothetical protein
MRRISKLAIYAGMASLLAVGAPAAAMGAITHTGRSVPEPRGFNMESCTGTVFGDATFQNVDSHNYLAKSTRDDNLVLVTGTAQRFDGYSDSAGHTIIYICGTNLVFTDVPKADCSKGFTACAYLENYNDSKDQWWTRDFDGDDQENIVSTAHAKGWTLTDPGGTTRNGQDVTLSPLRSGLKSQMFVFKGTD